MLIAIVASLALKETAPRLATTQRSRESGNLDDTAEGCCRRPSDSFRTPIDAVYRGNRKERKRDPGRGNILAPFLELGAVT